MARYVIGDIQGCYLELQNLLQLIHFQADCDELYLLGDLVNRGPDSLSVLRWAYQNQVKMVLGNHDLHLLALHFGVSHLRKSDTLAPILCAQDRDVLMAWLLRQPLLIDLPDALLVHAGVLPSWSRAEALALAKDVQKILSGSEPAAFFRNMYGNSPQAWNANMQGIDRWRFAVNTFTRMRLVDQAGALDLDYKGELPEAPPHLGAWFEYPQRAMAGQRIVCGHWSALGLLVRDDLCVIDTGCIWGGHLTAFDLDSGRIYQVPAMRAYQSIGD